MTETLPRAMVLAAGFGKRLRPITDNLPKPLVEVAGRSLLDRCLDRLEAAGVETAVVNHHYLGQMIAAHLAARARPEIVLSPEEVILETGGGIAQALRLSLGGLQEGPFYAVNADICWLDGGQPALARLAAAWDPGAMDVLLLLHPTIGAVGYGGQKGDFFLEPEGRIRRPGDGEIAPFVFTGVQILHPRLFEGAEEGAYSLNRLYDKAAAAGRLWGLRHDGQWFHVGTPRQLCEVEEVLEKLIGRAG